MADRTGHRVRIGRKRCGQPRSASDLDRSETQACPSAAWRACCCCKLRRRPQLGSRLQGARTSLASGLMGGPHPQSNTRIEQNGSVVHSFGVYGDGVGVITGLTIKSMAFGGGQGRVPPTQSAILSPDCASFWFCGTVKSQPSSASCRGANWVRGSSKSLPPAPAPPGPPAPPPPPGNAVQELTAYTTSQCIGSSAMQGTWKYDSCSALIPAAVPGYIAVSVGSVMAVLGPPPHLNVTFHLFSDVACKTLLPATEKTLQVTLNTCTHVNPGVFSRFQGFEKKGS
eukprot:SAG31_NODE_5412_length_2551_cov_1.276509_4_plen_284_part_00